MSRAQTCQAASGAHLHTFLTLRTVHQLWQEMCLASVALFAVLHYRPFLASLKALIVSGVTMCPGTRSHFPDFPAAQDSGQLGEAEGDCRFLRKSCFGVGLTLCPQFS